MQPCLFWRRSLPALVLLPVLPVTCVSSSGGLAGVPHWDFSIVNKVGGPLTDLQSFNRKIFSHLSRCWIHFYRLCFYIRIFLKFRQNSESWSVTSQYYSRWEEDSAATVRFAALRNCPTTADTAVDVEVMHKPQTHDNDDLFTSCPGL